MTRLNPSTRPDPLPMRWAVILLIAAMIGLATGALTFMQTAGWPAAILAALGASGSAVPVLHQVIGK